MSAECTAVLKNFHTEKKYICRQNIDLYMLSVKTILREISNIKSNKPKRKYNSCDWVIKNETFKRHKSFDSTLPVDRIQFTT